MAKMKFELDLNWLEGDEDGYINFDEFIKDEIMSQISNQITSKIAEKIEKKHLDEIQAKVNKKLAEIDSKIDNKINEITENLLNRNITIYDKYGDVVKKDVNIMDMFKEKMDNFLTEKVDGDGKTSGYNRNQTRIDYLVNKNIGYSMESKVADAARQVSKKIEEYVNKTLKEQIGEEVSKVIGLDKITSRINGGDR